VTIEHSRRRSGDIARDSRAVAKRADRSANLIRRDHSRPQDPRLGGREIDDGRLDTDLGRAAIENQVHCIAE